MVKWSGERKWNVRWTSNLNMWYELDIGRRETCMFLVGDDNERKIIEILMLTEGDVADNWLNLVPLFKYLLFPLFVLCTCKSLMLSFAGFVTWWELTIPSPSPCPKSKTQISSWSCCSHDLQTRCTSLALAWGHPRTQSRASWTASFPPGST